MLSRRSSADRRHLITLANSRMNGLGPLLWDLLAAAGVIDAIEPAEQVRLAVRVTEADGYTTVVVLAEISPKFVGRLFSLPTTRTELCYPIMRCALSFAETNAAAGQCVTWFGSISNSRPLQAI